jgi:hemerythrin-like domain-containing protein
MHRAITVLMDEHRVIEKVLAALETAVANTEKGAPLERAALRDFAEFFGLFADRCHHGKEEDRLFTAMVAHGFPKEMGPIAVMLADHDEGRRCVGVMRQAGGGQGPLSPEEFASVRLMAQEYIPLLRSHILKEDNVLYPMALQALPDDVLDGLADSYEAFEHEVMGHSEHERLHRLAESLVGSFPPDRARMAAASGCMTCSGHA